MTARIRRRSLVLIAALVGSALGAVVSLPAPAVALRPDDATEFPIVANGSNMVTGADGNLWWADGTNVFRMTTSGGITTFVPPGGATWVAPGPDGNMWYAKFGPPNVVGNITPAGF